ncbi:hypothetical protein F5Y00DRAFT_235889 [Daldinia vernicosa]|uniref:uncharacterized protein n=1 Tax=Daldinia vernicosa TaxID=114800 RepID=UPI0020089499|nr:uncharacterized protein F5Y00DRAFT_235889 [Daldinia vernicosa]KAI0849196.1 hypothetical protein F5Y00DRAFT_235889 [Daldinia vernicosa]
MGRALLSFSVRLGLLLTASASRLLFQPLPTQARDGAFATLQPMPTTAPEYYASIELLRRDEYHMGHDTCGFGALDPGITYKCYSDIGTCENISGYRGCCTGELKACSSSFWTQCDDYDPMSYCGMSSKTRCCQSGLPYCITWLFSTSGSTVSAWDCDSQSKTREFELLATPLSLIDSATSSTTNDLTTTSSTHEPDNSHSVATSSSTVSSSTSIDTTTVPLSNSSGTPIGAIVGGVVGGVAVICLTILGIFFIKKYQKGTHTTASAPPILSGPQELLGSGMSSPYPTPSHGNYAPILQHDASGQLKYQAPVAQATQVAEAPYTPATGTGYNRAELG